MKITTDLYLGDCLIELKIPDNSVDLDITSTFMQINVKVLMDSIHVTKYVGLVSPISNELLRVLKPSELSY